jgi:hypothetical protein
VKPDTPLWNAIFDLRAAVARSGNPGKFWDTADHVGAYDDLHQILLQATGLTLPWHLFEVICRLTKDGWKVWQQGLNEERWLGHLAQRMAAHRAQRPDLSVADADALFSLARYGGSCHDANDDLWRYPLDEGDTRASFGLDGRAARFVNWLVDLAPVAAHAFLKRGSPLWNAIFDMRAAALRSDDGDSPGNVWCLNEPQAAYDDLNDQFWGAVHLTLPRHLFDAVWQLYCDFLEGGQQDLHRDILAPFVARTLCGDHTAYLKELRAKIAHHTFMRSEWTVREALNSFWIDRYGPIPA